MLPSAAAIATPTVKMPKASTTHAKLITKYLVLVSRLLHDQIADDSAAGAQL